MTQQQKLVPVADANLAATDVGSGTPLLLVHGFPLDHSMWVDQIAALADQHRVIAPDLRGFGRSTVTPGTVTMQQMADDLAVLLDVLGVAEPVALCGLSMGGYVAWQFWRRHAARLRALVLCDTRAVADTSEAAHNRLAMADRVVREGTRIVAEAMVPKLFGPETHAQRPELVESMRNVILQTDPEGIAAAQRGMAERPNVESWLAAIEVPCLVIVGEHDQISPPQEMREIADRLPKSQWLQVPNVGHMAPLENAEVVNAAIRKFLK